MSPLGFDPKKMYLFIANRFTDSNSRLQEQALNWIQILTSLEIIIPLPLLFAMFTSGIYSINEFSCFGADDQSNFQLNTNITESNSIKRSRK